MVKTKCSFSLDSVSPVESPQIDRVWCSLRLGCYRID